MSPFVYVRGNPDNLTAGTPAAMTDIQGPFYDIADYFNSINVALPPVVAALPGSPVDGQETYYQNAAMATVGAIWHLRYRAGSGSAYKWEFVGGAALYNEVATAEGQSAGAYGDMATAGPQIALPLPGDYDVTLGARLWNTTNGAQFLMSYQIGATAAADADAMFSSMPTSGAPTNFNMVRTRRKTGLTAVTLLAKYRTSGGGNGAGAERWMSACPVRVSA